MKIMPENSVSSIVTDPPYHLKSIVKRFGKESSAPAQFGSDGAYSRHSTGFMGKKWDGGDISHDPATWAECLRVAKPGAYLLAFGGTRTWHRLAVAIEDAGWEIRDTIMWIYGSGFPKSHNLKGDWEGWGTALKPAWEPIIMARKSVEGSVASNVMKYGTGAMNIDTSRVELDGEAVPINKLEEWSGFGQKVKPEYEQEINTKGRWPANFIHDGSDEVIELFPQTESAAMTHEVDAYEGDSTTGFLRGRSGPSNQRADSGSASRFFYCAKATKEERDRGLDNLEEKITAPDFRPNDDGKKGIQSRLHGATVKGKNHHPTVKPIALMRYLCKLVTPPNGKVFDPFMGSGSTGVAALLEGFPFIGSELEEDYFKIAKQRINTTLIQEEFFKGE